MKIILKYKIKKVYNPLDKRDFDYVITYKENGVKQEIITDWDGVRDYYSLLNPILIDYKIKKVYSKINKRDFYYTITHKETGTKKELITDLDGVRDYCSLTKPILILDGEYWYFEEEVK